MLWHGYRIGRDATGEHLWPDAGMPIMNAPEHASLSRRVGDVLALSPATVAMDFQGETTTWGALNTAAARIEAELDRAGVARDAPIGWFTRNGPAAVAAYASLLQHGRPIAPLRPSQSVASCCEDIRTERLQAIVGDDASWSIEDIARAAAEVGSMGIRVSADGTRVDCVAGLEKPGPGPFRPEAPGIVMERMSSGTTGAPKRMPVTEDVLLAGLKQTVEMAKTLAEPPSLKKSPAFITFPLSHAAGMSTLMTALYLGRPVVLFEKFDVATWLQAIRRWRPKSTVLVPTMIKMILKSEATREDLSSLIIVRTGTAHLDTNTQFEFEDRFGVPILIDYGATEFVGGVACWTLDEHRKYRVIKRGSVGRARLGIQLRVIDQESGAPLATGEIGQLQIKADRFGPDWITTMDWASIDADGFMFIHGRIDDAINRGGFKILPDEVSAVLRDFPGIEDAEVVGMPHESLGEVPLAAIEVSDGPIDVDALRSFARSRLAAYQVPVEFRIIPKLPRTGTYKVSRPELRAMLGLPSAAVK